MKKSILIISAACIMLLAGCSSAEEDHSELDNLIEQLQTTHLNTGSPEGAPETEEAIPYKSLTGTVTAFSENGITVKAEGVEKKFTVDETTQILGGDRETAKTVTVIYCEPEKKSKSITANVITIIESSGTGTESTAALPEPQTDAVTETAAESVSESEEQSETAAETETEPEDTAADTGAEPEDTSEATKPEETVTEAEETTDTEPEETAEDQTDTQSETETETQTETLSETDAQSEQQTE